MTIHLGRPLPDASRDRPGRRRGNSPAGVPPESATPACRPYLVLLPVGFAVPPPLPGARCALTAPFHPCRQTPKVPAGGLLSVALSLGSPPPGVTRHRVSVEPGLSSPAATKPATKAAIRPSGPMMVGSVVCKRPLRRSAVCGRGHLQQQPSAKAGASLRRTCRATAMQIPPPATLVLVLTAPGRRADSPGLPPSSERVSLPCSGSGVSSATFRFR